ncbi:DUF7679 family protein [Ligilactobacillus acidipiscis]|uniref:DUF7679 family protein n=1 Tax=Ligilactobacillus acidipiscis TaxID=89059 RepID=UPI0023F66FE3|nr:hypothetical protein [Ligilactobacillus acidipiscis]WEV58200.1 hypothetical protein OZX66_12320 [Ligilactobacillus acidipiscis]
MRKQHLMWCVLVQRVSGETKFYRLSHDLQIAFDIDPSGRKQLKKALLIVPLAPYYQKPDQPEHVALPPMGVRLVQKLLQKPQRQARNFLTTRGQFIGQKYWPERTRKELANYLCHDYPFWSHHQIKKDLEFWHKQRHTQGRHPSKLMRAITNQHIRRQCKRVMQQQIETKQKFWEL